MRYRFLIGWMSGSDGNCGEANGIETPDDLLVEGNDVLCEEYDIPDVPEADNLAVMVGRGLAWEEDYTSHDTFSICQKFINGEWESL